jgi:hypothetical protein
MLEAMSTIVYFDHSYGMEEKLVEDAVLNIKPHLKDIFNEARERLDKLYLHAKIVDKNSTKTAFLGWRTAGVELLLPSTR